MADVLFPEKGETPKVDIEYRYWPIDVSIAFKLCVLGHNKLILCFMDAGPFFPHSK